MAKLNTEGITFDFPSASELFKFDQQDKSSSNYHTLNSEMKAVDVIAELPDKDIYIEIKDFQNKLTGELTSPNLEHLLYNLKYKYRDSFLYRFGQGKVSKPIIYICLMEHLDRHLLMQLHKRLSKNIPASIINGWTKEILNDVIVIDKSNWNRSLSKLGTIS